ncbi:hypothetical protein [Sphingomonas sp. GB1N7]|uniref:hypothetical protein n=1 Tax=Parasphingomonas caseinilytica TaxID=3096158 RepID=UPI002FCBA801
MRKSILVLAAIALTAPGMARDRSQVPEAVPAGKPESCLSIPRIRATHVHGDRVIDFETTGGKVYRNTLPNSCPGLGFREAFAYETSLSQLCSVDIITVIENPPVSRGASCGLGQFQPVTLVKTPKR